VSRAACGGYPARSVEARRGPCCDRTMTVVGNAEWGSGACVLMAPAACVANRRVGVVQVSLTPLAEPAPESCSLCCVVYGVSNVRQLPCGRRGG